MITSFAIDMPEKLLALFQSIVGQFGCILLVVIGCGIVAICRRLRPASFTLLLFLVISLFDYLPMPRDWMPEFRFATPFYVFLYLYLAFLLEAWFRLVEVRPFWHRLMVVACGALCSYSLVVAITRTHAFVSAPTVPLQGVAEEYGIRYNRCANLLGKSNASLLTPDLGGTLLCSHMRVYDLAMLCDATIARTLGKNQAAFYNYVFVQAKPVFIHTHQPWAQMAALDKDVRFQSDYIRIGAADPGMEHCADPGNGDFVRKDALGNHLEKLPRMRAILDGYR